MPTHDEIDTAVMLYANSPEARQLIVEILTAAEYVRNRHTAKAWDTIKARHTESLGPCLRQLVAGTEHTWTCKRCFETWRDPRVSSWRPYVCRLSGNRDMTPADYGTVDSEARMWPTESRMPGTDVPPAANGLDGDRDELGFTIDLPTPVHPVWDRTKADAELQAEATLRGGSLLMEAKIMKAGPVEMLPTERLAPWPGHPSTPGQAAADAMWDADARYRASQHVKPADAPQSVDTHNPMAGQCTQPWKSADQWCHHCQAWVDGHGARPVSCLDGHEPSAQPDDGWQRTRAQSG
jgi:hypothetical protein